ncbi:MAG TPA: hypothetical protein EYM68_09030, partial [Gammaproteobacteria bacterium]|nr:hypothetical protein [Gammaproteobacteria bacterium]
MIARNTHLIGLLSAIAIAPFTSAPVATADEADVNVKARVVTVIDGCRDLNKNGKIDAYENWRLPIEQRVEDLLARMTLQEKIGQTAYPSLKIAKDKAAALGVEDRGVKTTVQYEVNQNAGFLMVAPFPSTKACAESMNQVQQWAEETRLGIPLIMGIDPHTHIYKGTRIVGGDRSLALSATDNLETVRKVYDVWRKEMRASGIHLLLGPQ